MEVPAKLTVTGPVLLTKNAAKLLAAMTKSSTGWKPNIHEASRKAKIPVSSATDAWKRLLEENDVRVEIVITPKKWDFQDPDAVESFTLDHNKRLE